MKTGLLVETNPDAPAQDLEHRYLDRSSPLTADYTSTTLNDDKTAGRRSAWATC